MPAYEISAKSRLQFELGEAPSYLSGLTSFVSGVSYPTLGGAVNASATKISNLHSGVAWLERPQEFVAQQTFLQPVVGVSALNNNELTTLEQVVGIGQSGLTAIEQLSGIAPILLDTQVRVTTQQEVLSGLQAEQLTQNGSLSGLDARTQGIQIAALIISSSISGVTNLATDAQTRVTATEVTVAAHDVLLGSLISGTATLTSSVSGLSTQATSTQARTTSLEGSASGLSAASADSQTRITALEGEVGAFLSGVSTITLANNASGINALALDNQSRINGLTVSVADAGSSISGLTNILTSTQHRLGVSEQDINVLESTVIGMQVQISDLSATTSGVQAQATYAVNQVIALGGLYSGITNTQPAVSGLTVGLIDTQNRVTILEATVSNLSGFSMQEAARLSLVSGLAITLGSNQSGIENTVGSLQQRVTAIEGVSNAGSVVFVDSVFGNDSTGSRQNASRPFATLTSAKNAALPGDIIRVGRGVYDEAGLHKSNVDWYFEPGAVVQYSGSGLAAIFTFTGDAKILGYGQLLYSGISPVVNAMVVTNGTVEVGNTLVKSLTSVATLQQVGGTLKLNSSSIVNSNLSGVAFVKSGGNATFKETCVLVSGDGATEIISAATPQVIKVYGTLVGNRGLDSDVTLAVGSLEVDTDVTE